MPIQFKEEGDAEQTESVDASSILSEAKSKIQELQGLIAKSNNPKDKAKIDSINSQLAELEVSLGYSPDDEEPQAKPTGRLTAEAGAKDAKPIY